MSRANEREPVEPEPREAQWIELAAAGDVAAYEQLYRRHVGRVHALCLRMSRDATEAEDLVQDAFVRIWEKLGSFRGDSSFGTWVYRVTVNLVIESFRSKKRWRERIDAVVDPDALPSPAYRALPRSDVDLERAIASLPERARLVFVLHDVEGYKHREIAEMTGTAVGTCKAHLHHARRALRATLGESMESVT